MNIDNTFFDCMVNHIYPSELQLDKANVSDTETSFFDIHLSISDDFVKGRFLDFRMYHNLANLFSKLLESTFYKEIGRFQ